MLAISRTFTGRRFISFCLSFRHYAPYIISEGRRAYIAEKKTVSKHLHLHQKLDEALSVCVTGLQILLDNKFFKRGKSIWVTHREMRKLMNLFCHHLKRFYTKAGEVSEDIPPFG